MLRSWLLHIDGLGLLDINAVLAWLCRVILLLAVVGLLGVMRLLIGMLGLLILLLMVLLRLVVLLLGLLLSLLWSLLLFRGGLLLSARLGLSRRTRQALAGQAHHFIVGRGFLGAHDACSFSVNRSTQVVNKGKYSKFYA